MRENAVNQLTLELLAWIDREPRTYADVMDAWRSNCPRHPIWEEALSGGLLQVENGVAVGMKQAAVTLTPRGQVMLAESRL